MTGLEIRNEINKIKKEGNLRLNMSNDNTQPIKNWNRIFFLMNELLKTDTLTFDEKSDYIDCKEVIKIIENFSPEVSISKRISFPTDSPPYCSFKIFKLIAFAMLLSILTQKYIYQILQHTSTMIFA